MIRLGDLTQFRRVEPLAVEDEATGEWSASLVPFREDRERTVRLTVNAVAKTVVTIWPLEPGEGVVPDEHPLFRVLVQGLEVIEFYAFGAFAIEADAEIWLQSHDGQPVHAVVPDAQTFTRIAERRPRNPEVERLEAMLIRNNERRMGAMLEEVRREREAFYAAREAEHRGAGAPGGDQPAPEPADRAGEPAHGAGEDGGGTQGVEGDAARP